MFCKNCGTQLAEGTSFCGSCGASQNAGQPQQPVQPVQPQQPVQPVQPVQPNAAVQYSPSDNSKIFSILSYIGILWLVGLLVSPEKNDPKVRHHVSQGIILSIAQFALGTVVGIISGILTATMTTTRQVLWTSYTEVSPAAGIISGILMLCVGAFSIAMMIIGILNVCKGSEAPLPIIGNFAFYHKSGDSNPGAGAAQPQTPPAPSQPQAPPVATQPAPAPAAELNKPCAACGALLPSGTVFCSACGKKQD